MKLRAKDFYGEIKEILSYDLNHDGGGGGDRWEVADLY